MECPKCRKTMHGYSGPSISSGATRHDGDQAEYIVGKSCINCGTWIDDEPIVAKPGVPDPTGREGQKPKLYLITEADKTVWEYRESILRMLAEKTDMKNIIRLMSRAGQPAKPKNIMASILRLQDGRLAEHFEA